MKAFIRNFQFIVLLLLVCLPSKADDTNKVTVGLTIDSTAFGGIFFVLDKFDHILSSVIDSHLGLRRNTDKTTFFYLIKVNC